MTVTSVKEQEMVKREIESTDRVGFDGLAYGLSDEEIWIVEDT